MLTDISFTLLTYCILFDSLEICGCHCMRCEQETCGRVMNINEVGHSLEYNPFYHQNFPKNTNSQARKVYS